MEHFSLFTTDEVEEEEGFCPSTMAVEQPQPVLSCSTLFEQPQFSSMPGSTAVEQPQGVVPEVGVPVVLEVTPAIAPAVAPWRRRQRRPASGPPDRNGKNA